MATARKSFSYAQGKRNVIVHRGDELADDHPVVKASPHLFRGGSGVEQATAAPGERRDAQVPKHETAEQVLERVGDDPDKAKAELEAEQAKDKPRKTLVADLERIANR